jgi:bacteriocin-like protein
MKGTISMQIEFRYFWQGAASQQDLSAKEIELTDTELAAIYGGADQPNDQQTSTSDDRSVERQAPIIADRPADHQTPIDRVLGLNLFGLSIPILGSR